MEKTDVHIENEEQVSEESKKVIDQLTDDVSKIIEETNGEIKTTENTIEEENIKTDDDAIVPSTPSKSIEEQENVIDTNTTVSENVLSGRANVPFKEVNGSEKEACTTIVNGIKNINNKKRELDNGDEQIQEKILDNDEQTGDQIKKIKIGESMDTLGIETKESENSVTANDAITVEV